MTRTYPIILAHGICRFDILSDRLFDIDNSATDDGLHYFRNIRTHLMGHGFDCYHSHVGWAEGVKARSATLRGEVERVLAVSNADKVHIIGHSMGGLDARHMLYDGRQDQFESNIASVTTIGTPHWGSSFADYVLGKGDAVISKFGLALAGVRDLTLASCAAFNDESEQWEANCGVPFKSYAGQQPWAYIFTPLKFSFKVIENEEGPNDGLVSVRSAQWKPEYSAGPPLDADHLNLVGWWNASELIRGVRPAEMEGKIKQFYLDIAEELAANHPSPQG